MTTQLTFPEEFHYDDAPVGITIPVILHYGEKGLRSEAKVDTGAEVCLFLHEHTFYWVDEAGFATSNLQSSTTTACFT
jgi:hypothetical protein